ncbi:MAG: hypothetical protein HOP96_04335 [Sphingomonas sp.]|nr:hypothetical protein [Sphingomonas sp.]
MTDTTSTGRSPNWHRVRPLGWGAAAVLILTPLVAMLFTTEVNWTVGDFVFAALLIGGVGMTLELAVRISGDWNYRAAAMLGLAAGFFLIWANGAVGYVGSEANPYNQLFFAVVGIAFVGALIAGFRAKGMAWAMASAGAAHAMVGGYGFPADPRTGPMTLAFVGMWFGSAWLFRKAARAR